MESVVESRTDRKPTRSQIARLKRFERCFGADPKGVAFSRALSMADLVGAYSLVHDVFVSQGYIHPDPTGLRMRVYEALPETATFVAKQDGKVIGVSALVPDSPDLGLPSDAVFGAEIDALRGEGRKVCEITDQAVSADWRGTTVTVGLMQCLCAQMLTIGCTDLVFAVSPSHVKFYELVGYVRISEIKSYSTHVNDPVVLMHGADLCHRFDGLASGDDDAENFLRKYYVDDNPYRRYVDTWQIVAERFFSDPTVLHELYVVRSGLLEKCSERERQAIRSRWGTDVFSSVRTAAAHQEVVLSAAS